MYISMSIDNGLKLFNNLPTAASSDHDVLCSTSVLLLSIDYLMRDPEALFVTFPSLFTEIEMFVQTKGRTRQNVSGAEVKEKQLVPEQDQRESKEKIKLSAMPERGKQGALPTIITVLLLSPLVVLVSVGIYLCRRNSGMSRNHSGPAEKWGKVFSHTISK